MCPSNEPRVLNKSHDYIPTDAVYVGRPSKWGNPFSHLGHSTAQFNVLTREDAIAAYRAWILNQPLLIKQAQEELRGRDLVCWCSPKECHGEVLLEIANAPR